MHLIKTPLAAVVLATASQAIAAPRQDLPAPWLPIDPGPVRCEVGASGAALSNDAVRFGVVTQGGRLKPSLLLNGFTHQTRSLDGELFAVKPRGGKDIGASQFVLEGALACKPVAAVPTSARAAERRAGVSMTASLTDPTSGLKVGWRAVLRDGTNYVREEFTLEADRTLDLATITLIDLKLGKPWVDGTTDGSPLISGDDFFGFEHPTSQSRAIDGATSSSSTAPAARTRSRRTANSTATSPPRSH